MKARTKEQQEFVGWSNSHPNLSEKQKRYAHKYCFWDEILVSKYECTCTKCKYTWGVVTENEQKEATCPNCHTKLNTRQHRKTVDMRAYFTVMTSVNGTQVIRWFDCTRKVNKTEDEFTYRHVGTEFIKPNGKLVSVELNKCTMCWEKDKWSYSSNEQSLKRYSTFARYCYSNGNYISRLSKTARQRGFQKIKMLEGYEDVVLSAIIQNAYFESLLKCGHYAVIRDWARNWYYGCLKEDVMYLSKQQQVMIKLANRRGFKFDTKEKWADYNDYLNDLVRCGRDFHNPKIMFPENFQAEHERISKLVERKRKVKAQADNLQRLSNSVKNDKQKQKWIDEYYKRYGDMVLKESGFIVRALISIDDFAEEAAEMHHCIATYLGKQDALLLSIERYGKKTETAEINLKGNGEIIQCRGHCNQSSDWHDEIVKMLERNMDEFTRRYRAKLNDTQSVSLVSKI